MIYADTSIILARLFSEKRGPPDSFWDESLVASRLVEYETYARINSKGLETTHSDAARAILSRISMLELTPPILSRAMESFPVQVRTLDALHLSSLCFIREKDPSIRLATYDVRLARAAHALKIRVFSP